MEVYSTTALGILCMDQETPQLNPSGVAFVLQSSVVMEEFANLPQAF